MFLPLVVIRDDDPRRIEQRQKVDSMLTKAAVLRDMNEGQQGMDTRGITYNDTQTGLRYHWPITR